MTYVVVITIILVLSLVASIVSIIKNIKKLSNYKKYFIETYKEFDLILSDKINYIRLFFDELKKYNNYDREFNDGISNLKSEIDKYYSSGTRENQVINNDNLTIIINSLNDLINSKYTNILENNDLKTNLDKTLLLQEELGKKRIEFNGKIVEYNKTMDTIFGKIASKILRYKKWDTL